MQKFVGFLFTILLCFCFMQLWTAPSGIDPGTKLAIEGAIMPLALSPVLVTAYCLTGTGHNPYLDNFEFTGYASPILSNGEASVPRAEAGTILKCPI